MTTDDLARATQWRVDLELEVEVLDKALRWRHIALQEAREDLARARAEEDRIRTTLGLDKDRS